MYRSHSFNVINASDRYFLTAEAQRTQRRALLGVFPPVKSELTNAEIGGAVRIGIGKFNTDAEIETAAAILIAEIDRIRSLL